MGIEDGDVKNLKPFSLLNKYRSNRPLDGLGDERGLLAVNVLPLPYAVRSTILAPAALALTDAIPFCIAEADEYISLLPMACPLVAFRTKFGSPLLEVLRS